MSNFISLHNQTVFSLLDSLCSVQGLFNRAKELGQTAIAITDHGSLASAWDALKISKKTGVKLIIGCESYFSDDASNLEAKLRHVIFIAKNAKGYRNLLTLNKKAFDQGRVSGSKVYPIVDWKLLEQYHEGMICLTACGNGIVSQQLSAGDFEKAEETLLKLKKLFGDDLGIEVLANNMKRSATMYTDEIDQKYINRQLIKLGKSNDIKVVASCNTHYITKEEYDTHNVLLAIGAKQPIFSNFRLRYPVNDFYLKTEDEMIEFFVRNYGEDYAREIVNNSKFFADKCEDPEWIDPKHSNPTGKELPTFPVKDQKDYNEFKMWVMSQDNAVQSLEEDKAYLRYCCSKALTDYFKINNIPSAKRQMYFDRLDEEIDVFEYHGFSSYMLIVADYLNWARENDIALGLGRGSVGGCYVAFLLKIHDADPIKYDLIFARFHNKSKSAFPDIDSDIAPSGRSKLHKYLRDKYGEDCVAHVSNVNRITPKVYVRDIARSCELGGSREAAVKIGNEIADCIASDIKSIDDAYKKIPLFSEYCKKYPQLLDHKNICNQFRAWSTHAGGIIIAGRPLVGLIPLRKDKDGQLAIEYDKDKAEENGLVKMDTLGLSTLDVITKTNELIVAGGKEIPEIDYSVYDEKAYSLVSKGDTFGVFQLGTSGGTIDLCKKIKPKTIEDISHINALARPSARDMRSDFIKAKAGKLKVPLLDPTLKRAFEKTFGFGLYEESLMFLAQDVAGWSLHDADKLRKMTKAKGKYPEKVAQWRTEFIDGAIKNNVDKVIATRIWDEVIELFGGYGFNASLCILTHINIYTSTGKYLDTIPIKDVVPGMFVKSRDEQTKKPIFIEVLNLHDHGEQNLVEVELTTGEKVQCTMDHKFRTQETGEMLPLHQIVKKGYSIVIE